MCPGSHQSRVRSPPQAISNAQLSGSPGSSPRSVEHRPQVFARQRPALRVLGRVDAVDHPVLPAGLEEGVAAPHPLAVELGDHLVVAQLLGRVGARVPDRHRAGPVLARRGSRPRSRGSRAGGPRCGPPAGWRPRSGSWGTPRGSAQESATPRCSSRRSQCRLVASCCWTTKRPPPACPASPPCGSGVRSKSRFRRYSPSRSATAARASRPRRSGDLGPRGLLERVVAGREMPVGAVRLQRRAPRVEQISVARGQRVWKRQADGGSIGLGTSPSSTICSRERFSRGSGIGTAESSAAV